MNDFESLFENINQHLSSSRQNWLFGAGISCDANIPLMYPLTKRVGNIIMSNDNTRDKEIFGALISDLDEVSSHIEHYLSHLGDLIALADRSKDNCAFIKTQSFTQTLRDRSRVVPRSDSACVFTKRVFA